jgi:uncharacterized membrane protein YhaH (DUF805 family)
VLGSGAARQFLAIGGAAPFNSQHDPTRSTEEGNMGSLSIFHLLILIVVLVTLVVPPVKILRKAGYSGWWVLLWLVPLGNLIGLWIFAFADWPNLANRQS